MSAIATKSSAASSAKNRVGVINLFSAKRVGARAASGRGPHWEFRSLEEKTASANTVHENWNRFYDPVVGQYTSIEPLYRAPVFALKQARTGQAPPAYAYAQNNPLHNVDPSGRQSSSFLGPMFFPPGYRDFLFDFFFNPCTAGTCVPPPSPPSPPSIPSEGPMCSGQSNAQSEKERCKKVGEDCREECSESSLPTWDYGYTFWNCVNRCKERNGCAPGMG